MYLGYKEQKRIIHFLTMQQTNRGLLKGTIPQYIFVLKSGHHGAIDL